MQAPEEAVGLTASYVRICGGGIFFIVAYNLLSAIFRGLGDSRSPLLFVLVACIVNIAGDLVLVAGFDMDAAGAAHRDGSGAGCQRGARGRTARQKETAVRHHARRLSPESPVQKVLCIVCRSPCRSF